MKKRLMTGAAVAITLMVALPCIAEDTASIERPDCGIEGTWYGTNSSGFNFVFRMEKNAAGGYSMVADGWPDVVYCLEYTAWHGELVKIGPNTFRFRQIELCDPNPDIFGPMTELLLWASEGELTLIGCNQVEAYIPVNGAYVWGTGKVPFIDPFDIPFPDPVTGIFDRMPRP